MATRMVEILVHEELAEGVEGFFQRRGDPSRWRVDAGGGRTLFKVIVDSAHVEGLLAELEDSLGAPTSLRAVVLAVEATAPRQESEEAARRQKENGVVRSGGLLGRISLEELHEDIAGSARLTPLFVLEVVLAAVVAAIGLARDMPAVVIGAMVIAPLLGPNMALALATSLGDLKLAKRAAIANATGVALALALSVVIGMVWEIDPTVGEVASRTSVQLSDVLLALASGVAGALAFSSGVATSLVGVMVAVALMPPTVVAGLMLGEGRMEDAAGALLLVGVNVTSVNLAGVATFALQGVRPRRWWQKERGRRATRIAATLWGVALGLLAALIYLAAFKHT